MDTFFSTLISLALALLLSLGLGRVASRIGVPRVTVYILVGLVLGPHVGQRFFDEGGLATEILLGPHTDMPLRVVEQLAIGFILFGIGAEFRFQTFREVGPRILGLSAAEIGLTGLLVGLAVGAGTGDWRLAVIAPALAIASAPSATPCGGGLASSLRPSRSNAFSRRSEKPARTCSRSSTRTISSRA